MIAPGWWASRRFDLPMPIGASTRVVIGSALGSVGGALYLWTIVLFARARGTQVPYVLAGLIIPIVYLLYIKLFEETELEARFGADYLAYRASTPFIVPRWPARR